MVVIGVTGKTASGKSTVSSYISKIKENVLVLDVDKIAKDIYYKNSQILNDLRNVFGEDIFNAERKLKFNALARKVFSGKVELKKLNRLMFPLIRREVKTIVNHNLERDYIVIDAAVLFDSKLDLLCDYVVWVKASKENRKLLLKNKNKDFSDEDINLRIEGQHIEINKNRINFTIENNDSKQNLYRKIENVLRKIEKQEKIKRQKVKN